MRQVWKYSLPEPKRSTALPIDARILDFANQNGELVFWAEVDTTRDVEMRHFAVFNTGTNLPPGYCYRGTTSVGPIVWHLYEYSPEEEVRSDGCCPAPCQAHDLRPE